VSEPETRSSDPGGGEPDPIRQGVAALGAIGVAVLLIVAAGGVGIGMAMHRGTDGVAWGNARVEPPMAAMGFQLDGLQSMTVQHYEFARSNPSVYGQVPCFCGCVDMLGHRNLEDCFVTPDGAWESHASGCGVCIQESQMVMRMMSGGMGAGMMRDRIVAAFGGPVIGSSG
jgi:hypothetical protein